MADPNTRRQSEAESVSDVPDFRQATRHLEAGVRSRELMRMTLAYFVLGLITLLSGGIGLATIQGCIGIEVAKDLTLALVAPLFSIFAAIIGFYYGHESK